MLFEKALLPINVTVLGIVTFVDILLESKARFPIAFNPEFKTTSLILLYLKASPPTYKSVEGNKELRNDFTVKKLGERNNKYR